MFATRMVAKAHPGEVRKPIGWLMRWRSLRIWLTAPASAWNRKRKIKPVISSGSSHGMMTSERASRRSGNLRLNSSARAKPMRNWKNSEPAVKMNVRTMTLCVTGWSKVAL